MAKYYNRGKNNFKGSSYNRRKSYSSRISELRTLAYNMGRVQRGLNNTDSQLFESYSNGLNKEYKKRKSLF